MGNCTPEVPKTLAGKRCIFFEPLEDGAKALLSVTGSNTNSQLGLRWVMKINKTDQSLTPSRPSPPRSDPRLTLNQDIPS